MEGFADHLAAFLDAIGVDRVVVVGGSMGGVVAQHFALRHPERLRRLILVATGARTPDPEGALAKANSMAAHVWTEADIAGMVEGFFARMPPEPEREEYEAIVRAVSPAAAVEAARSNARSNTLDRLAQIMVPTLIVQGRHDRGRTPEHGALMQERLPDARLVIMENSGHTPQLEEPDAFHEAILPFIRKAANQE
jgi:pimeloyl-ACP methyl ester carboxylesterase